MAEFIAKSVCLVGTISLNGPIKEVFPPIGRAANWSLCGQSDEGGFYMHPQPLIAVRDVEASSRWYQQLLDCKSGHGGPNYERLVKNESLILQLHHWMECAKC